MARAAKSGGAGWPPLEGKAPSHWTPGGVCCGPARRGKSSPSSLSTEAHLIHSGIVRLVRLLIGEMSHWTENEFGVRKMWLPI